jgi:hypothetical protein
MKRLTTGLILVLVLLSGRPAFAAEFYAIITNFGGDPNARAHLDVSIDTRTQPGGASVDIHFDVFHADGTLAAAFSVPTNPNGFASSRTAPRPYRNLFDLTGGEPALIRVRTPQNAEHSTTTLYQRGNGSRLIVSVPPAFRTDGTLVHMGSLFPFAIGALQGTASVSLLVANVSGSDVAVDVSVGTASSAGSGKYQNGRLSNRNIWRLDLPPDDLNANLVLTSTGLVIVQLVIDDGRLNALTILPAF